MKHWVESTFSNLRIGIIPWNEFSRSKIPEILPIYKTDLVEHKSNCWNYSVGHRGHDVQETHKKDVVGIKTARTCHVTIIVSHFVSQFKKKYFFEISGLISFKSVFLRSYLRTESKYDRTIRLDSYVVLVTHLRIISYASKINQMTNMRGLPNDQLKFEMKNIKPIGLLLRYHKL